jgi:hypothetical protein
MKAVDHLDAVIKSAEPKAAIGGLGKKTLGTSTPEAAALGSEPHAHDEADLVALAALLTRNNDTLRAAVQ